MRVTVIGGGAAGMMAACTAAARGRDVTVLERNPKTCRKLCITGKGRCNLTNACPEDELMGSIIQNGFSIAVASFLLVRMDRRLEELTKAVISLGAVMEKIARPEN